MIGYWGVKVNHIGSIGSGSGDLGFRIRVFLVWSAVRGRKFQDHDS